jgi:hypothetical protein
MAIGRCTVTGMDGLGSVDKTCAKKEKKKERSAFP